jgi:hypothetical protein
MSGVLDSSPLQMLGYHQPRDSRVHGCSRVNERSVNDPRRTATVTYGYS